MLSDFNAPPNGQRNRSGLGTKHAFTSLDLLMDRIMTVACELKLRDETTLKLFSLVRREHIVSHTTRDSRYLSAVPDDDEDEINQFGQSLAAELADGEIFGGNQKGVDQESSNDQHEVSTSLGLRHMRQIDGGTACELFWDCWLLQAPNSHYCHNHSVVILDLLSTRGLRCLNVELRPASDPAWNATHKNHKTTLDECPERVIQLLMSKAFSVLLKAVLEPAHEFGGPFDGP